MTTANHRLQQSWADAKSPNSRLDPTYSLGKGSWSHAGHAQGLQWPWGSTKLSSRESTHLTVLEPWQAKPPRCSVQGGFLCFILKAEPGKQRSALM